MTEIDKFVSAGASPDDQTVGLTGLVPFAIVRPAPVELRPAPGTLRIQLELPAGTTLRPGAPVRYRLYGGEPGLEFERASEIVTVADPHLPLEIPYSPRQYPEPPPGGQLVVDVAFQHTHGYQDVQWRQPVHWTKSGKSAIELRFALPAAPA